MAVGNPAVIGYGGSAESHPSLKKNNDPPTFFENPPRRGQVDICQAELRRRKAAVAFAT